MYSLLIRPLGLAGFALAMIALLPMSGVLKAQFPPGRNGFLPFQPNGQQRPNMLQTMNQMGNMGMGMMGGMQGGMQGMQGGMQGGKAE